jgi:hypothetical protein
VIAGRREQLRILDAIMVDLRELYFAGSRHEGDLREWDKIADRTGYVRRRLRLAERRRFRLLERKPGGGGNAP